MEVLEACSPKTSGTLICINIIDMENADRIALMEAIDKLIAPYEFTIGADSAVFHLEDNDQIIFYRNGDYFEMGDDKTDRF